MATGRETDHANAFGIYPITGGSGTDQTQSLLAIGNSWFAGLIRSHLCHDTLAKGLVAFAGRLLDKPIFEQECSNAMLCEPSGYLRSLRLD